MSMELERGPIAMLVLPMSTVQSFGVSTCGIALVLSARAFATRNAAVTVAPARIVSRRVARMVRCRGSGCCCSIPWAGESSDTESVRAVERIRARENTGVGAAASSELQRELRREHG